MEIMIILKDNDKILVEKVAKSYEEAKRDLDLIEMQQVKWETLKQQIDRKLDEEFEN